MAEITHPEVYTTIGSAIRRVVDDHPGQYHDPLWGRKNTLHMKNLGFVIGYEDKDKSQWYRVDYDPHKGLHINWEQDTVDAMRSKTRLKECYLVKPHIIHPEDELYDWWRRTTLHHCTELPDEISKAMGDKRVWRGAFWT